jgi:ATP-dependent Clp protease ATP-binding subunit ClpC
MFERFTERARQVIVLAQDEALALKHNYIGTEHLLLGLLRDQDGLAARVLESFDVAIEEVRAQVEAMIGIGNDVTSGEIPFTPRVKRILDLSLREALSAGHNYISTEHLLLALAREGQGVAATVLLKYGASAERVRAEVLRLLPSRPGVAQEGGAVWLGDEPQPEFPVGDRSKARAVDVGSEDRFPRRTTGNRTFTFALAGFAFGSGVLVGWLLWGQTFDVTQRR